MYGVIPVEPDLPVADLAVLFMHNEGYSTMCGHAVIALGRWAVDSGIVKPQAPETRSEEHTSELQSLMRISYAVFCLKKNKYTTKQSYNIQCVTTTTQSY